MRPLTAYGQAFDSILFHRDPLLWTAWDEALTKVAETGNLHAIVDAVAIPGAVPR